MNANINNRISIAYHIAKIYTKKEDLLRYFTSSPNIRYESKEEYERLREYYAKEREVQLIAMFRIEPADGPYAPRTFCKIKCPINPLPVKGEFEVTSIGTFEEFLRENGWSYKQKLNLNMFK